ncbi:MAG: hypothetical protein Q8O62_10585 [Aequorivita sp.]|nr:hypothetical protein [Aequorivita sp.]
MRKRVFLKLLIICTIIAISCNKDDDNKDDQGCVKEENFFEAQFDGDIIEPYYNQGGGFGLYTLYLQRCSPDDNTWLITVRTEDDLSLYITVLDIVSTGIYSTTTGNPNHLAIDCAEVTSLFIQDEATNSYTFISSSNGTIEITEYDSGYGILVGTFTCELVSTTDPSIKKTITGDFNLNKSTLDNTKRPCWL